jgi:hypothetical protein
VGVAGRLGQGLRINEAGLAHGLPLLPGRDCRTTCAKSLKLLSAAPWVLCCPGRTGRW